MRRRCAEWLREGSEGLRVLRPHDPGKTEPRPDTMYTQGASYLVAVHALVWPLSGVHAHVFVEAGRLGETLPAH